MEQHHRKQRRAAKLKVEAGNCVRIALGERQQDMAAQLIDEAARLAKRSRELSGIDTGQDN